MFINILDNVPCCGTMHLKLSESRVYPLAGIKRANLSKPIYLVSYNSYAYNRMQQYRMVKGKVAISKCLLFVVPQLKKIDTL